MTSFANKNVFSQMLFCGTHILRKVATMQKNNPLKQLHLFFKRRKIAIFQKSGNITSRVISKHTM